MLALEQKLEYGTLGSKYEAAAQAFKNVAVGCKKRLELCPFEDEKEQNAGMMDYLQWADKMTAKVKDCPPISMRVANRAQEEFVKAIKKEKELDESMKE